MRNIFETISGELDLDEFSKSMKKKQSFYDYFRYFYSYRKRNIFIKEVKIFSEKHVKIKPDINEQIKDNIKNLRELTVNQRIHLQSLEKEELLLLLIEYENAFEFAVRVMKLYH